MSLSKIKDLLLSSSRPLFLFDDDPDGLCAYLQFYRQKRAGKAIIVKTTPRIDSRFVHYIEENDSDRVFILDIANVEEDFISEVHIPIAVVDHHNPREYNGVTYFNPRNEGRARPTSEVAYEIFGKDLWIATVGAVSDWQVPAFYPEFAKQYPDLAGGPDIEDILFRSNLSTLIRVFSFNLKGKTEDVRRSLRELASIETPYEILEQQTPAGAFVWKRFLAIDSLFEKLLAQGRSCVQGDFLVYEYTDDKLSLSKDLANRLLHEFPDKVIITARHKDGSVKMSTRSKYVILPPIITESIAGLEATGGGHEHACGVVVKSEDYSEWLRKFKALCSAAR